MRYLKYGTYLAIPLAFVCHFFLRQYEWEPMATFALAGIGVIPLAGLMGVATEHLAERTGPTWGGLLNATFGNAAELIIAIIANSRSPQMVAPGYQRQGAGVMPMPGQPQQQQAPAAGVSARGTLIGITGTFAGQKLTIGQATYTFGKGPSTFQITDDPTVSTNHAELTFHPQHGFVISDKGSTNGTYVNNQRIAQPTIVRDGDMIKLGMNTQFKIRVE